MATLNQSDDSQISSIFKEFNQEYEEEKSTLIFTKLNDTNKIYAELFDSKKVHAKGLIKSNELLIV
jgi:hypothetical protein